MKRYIKASDEMSYSEFKETYNYAVKQWPDVTSAFGNPKYKFVETEEKYKKNGSKWEMVESEMNEVSFINYMNVIDAVPFFRGLGGKEQVTTSYTALGKVPVEIKSTSPDGTEKTIRKYKITYNGH